MTPKAREKLIEEVATAVFVKLCTGPKPVGGFGVVTPTTEEHAYAAWSKARIFTDMRGIEDYDHGGVSDMEVIARQLTSVLNRGIDR